MANKKIKRPTGKTVLSAAQRNTRVIIAMSVVITLLIGVLVASICMRGFTDADPFGLFKKDVTTPQDKPNTQIVQLEPTPLVEGQYYEKVYVNPDVTALKNLVEKACALIDPSEDELYVSMFQLTPKQPIVDTYFMTGITNVEDVSKLSVINFNAQIGDTGTLDFIVYDYFQYLLAEDHDLDLTYYSNLYVCDDDNLCIPSWQNITADGAMLRNDGSLAGGYFNFNTLGMHTFAGRAVFKDDLREDFDKVFSATPFEGEFETFYKAEPLEKDHTYTYMFFNTDSSAWKDLYDWMIANKKQEAVFMHIDSIFGEGEQELTISIVDGDPWELKLDEMELSISASCLWPIDGSMFDSVDESTDLLEHYYLFSDSGDLPKELFDRLVSCKPFKPYVKMQYSFVDLGQGDQFDASLSSQEYRIVYKPRWADFAEDKFDVDIKIKFVNPESDWARGKDAEDYMSASAYLVDSQKTVKVEALKPFGEPIEVILMDKSGVKLGSKTFYYAGQGEIILVQEDGKIYFTTALVDATSIITTPECGVDQYYSNYDIKNAFEQYFGDSLRYYSEYDFPITILNKGDGIPEDLYYVEDLGYSIRGYQLGDVRYSYDEEMGIIIGGEEGLSIEEFLTYFGVDPKQFSSEYDDIYTAIASSLQENGITGDSNTVLFVENSMSMHNTKYDKPYSLNISIRLNADFMEQLKIHGLNN